MAEKKYSNWPTWFSRFQRLRSRNLPTWPSSGSSNQKRPLHRVGCPMWVCFWWLFYAYYLSHYIYSSLCFIFSQVRVKLLARLVTQFEGGKKNDLLQFILEDMRSRSELAFSLLYHEYNEYLSQQPSGSLDSYEQCLFTLLSGLQEKPEQRDGWESTRNVTNDWLTWYSQWMKIVHQNVQCALFFILLADIMLLYIRDSQTFVRPEIFTWSNPSHFKLIFQ